MSAQLLRATDLIGRPVVTLGGESPFEIKDIVFDSSTGRLLGFNLRNHGFLGSPAEERLALDDVHGLGPDAVVVADADCLDASVDLATGSGGDVLGNRILTDDGTELGEVVEVIITSGRSAEVVGFEVAAAEGVRAGDHHVFIPMPDTSAISGERIVVPDAAVEYIRDDLTGFGGAVAEFRERLSGGTR